MGFALIVPFDKVKVFPSFFNLFFIRAPFHIQNAKLANKYLIGITDFIHFLE